METIRHLALGCCILCAMAGLLHVFLPNGPFKPVINTVLLLYILTSVLSAGRSVDWGGLRVQIREWDTRSTPTQEYLDYAAGLAREASVRAVDTALRQAGIPAQAVLAEDTCRVTLQSAEDAGHARALLEEICGEMPYTLQIREAAP